MRAAILTTALSLCALPVAAAPVQWPDNGHWYQAFIVEEGIDFSSAAQAAEDLGGYLVSLTSEAENLFVFGLIDDPAYWFLDGGDNNEGPMIGAQYIGTPGTMNAFDWAWLSGEPWGYTNWDDGEPNFPYETVANFFSNEATAADPLRQPFWNNIPGGETDLFLSYIVEWDTEPTIPAPAPLALLALGLPGLLALRRRH